VTTLVVSAVAFVRDGAVLTVRKRGTGRFMLVGGKLEPGEDPAAAAVREALEEVGVVVDALEPLGEFVADAANEPDHLVHSSVFAASVPPGVEPAPLAEIEELRWLPLSPAADGPPDDLAPLLEHHVLPVLRARHFGGSVRA
jgi:8-oxo-dGTP diphosphatase